MSASGHLGDSLGVAGGGPRAATLTLSCRLCLFSPLLRRSPSGPSSAALLSGGHFYLDLLGECVCVCVGGWISLPLSLQHRCLLPVPLSVQSLCLWIGPKELQKERESENVRSGWAKTGLMTALRCEWLRRVWRFGLRASSASPYLQVKAQSCFSF